MIPNVGDFNIEIESASTIQHRMTGHSIIGQCDGVDALKQTIFKILNTERYQYEIYSWNYGVELVDLYGEPTSFVLPEIERRVQEALSMDDRITSVDSFEFDVSKKGVVAVNFTVHSIYGDLSEEMVVNY